MPSAPVRLLCWLRSCRTWARWCGRCPHGRRWPVQTLQGSGGPLSGAQRCRWCPARQHPRPDTAFSSGGRSAPGHAASVISRRRYTFCRSTRCPGRSAPAAAPVSIGAGRPAPGTPRKRCGGSSSRKGLRRCRSRWRLQNPGSACPCSPPHHRDGSPCHSA